MKFTSIFIGFCLLLSCIPPSLKAQLNSDDSLFYAKAINNAIAIFHKSEGDQSALYNGSQYAGYPFSFKDGHPFFYADGMMTGTITYDGTAFTNVLLQYDELSEFIIFQDAVHKIQLLNNRITRFSLGPFQFIRLQRKDSSSGYPLPTGFYQLLYDGKNRLLKKEVKTIREDIKSSSEGVVRYIEVAQNYYIEKDGVTYPVRRKKSVFEIFKDRKKELQQFIKINNLSYRKDRDNMLIKVTAWYDQLIK